MNNKIFFCALVSITLLSSFGSTSKNVLPKFAEKKAQQAFEEIWPNKAVHPEPISFDEKVVNTFITGLKRVELYKLVADGGEATGYMFLCASPSRHDYFDLLVIYHPDMTIATAEVLVYREDYGGEIGSRRWLKQFRDKTSKDKIEVNHDIQGISGATISVRSATCTIRGLTMAIQQLHDNGLL